MSRLSEVEALHEITQDARRLMQLFGPPPSHAIRLQQKLSPHHHLTLVLPQPITSRYIARGVDVSIAEKLNQTYLNKASSLKQVYEDKHRQALYALLDSGSLATHDTDEIIFATHSAYQARYSECLRSWRNGLDEACRVRFLLTENDIEVRKDARPTFKNESLPILERAFIANAYPSRVDKEELAEETGMEYKQINIWFQNRRARSKREGLSLQRTATFVPTFHTPRVSTSPSLASFADSGEAVSSTNSSQAPCEGRGGGRLDIITALPPPPHAFPTPYPPLYDEDRSPAGSFARSYKTPWPRTRVTNSIRRPSADLEQLTAQLANLSLSSNAPNRSNLPLPSFTLIPPRAPLPALIRTATALSRAQPIATLVSAAGSPPASNSREFRRIHRAVPTRVKIARQASAESSSAAAVTLPISIPYSRPSSRSHRSETRSPASTPRSLSLASTNSSRSTSSCSVVSSIGPLTPISTSPHIETSASVKISSSPTSHHMSSGIVDAVYIFSPSR